MEADDEAPCAYCSTQRALLHCAQHRTRLCLPCDLLVHHAAAPAHERAPLCDACHAAPAAALCGDHQAFLCAPCARAAGCDAERHAMRRARSYTGVPAVEELARILSGDTTPPLPPPEHDTWVPDLINVELLPDLPSTSSWHDDNVSTDELLVSGNVIETEGSFGGQMAVPTGDGDELFMQQDWPNLGDAGLDDFNFIAQDSNLTTSFNSMGHREGALEASPPFGYDHLLIATTVASSTDAVMECMANNNAAHQQLSSLPTTASSNNNNMGSSSSELHSRGNTFYASGMSMLPWDFGFEVKPMSSPTTTGAVYQDLQDAVLQQASSAMEQPSSQDMEARTKQQENRQKAMQRYMDKKKNRRFGKQIMYVSRKVRADTRNRVKGRFAKASSSSWHGDDQPTNS